jgi:hypothetical protein
MITTGSTVSRRLSIPSIGLRTASSALTVLTTYNTVVVSLSRLEIPSKMWSKVSDLLLQLSILYKKKYLNVIADGETINRLAYLEELILKHVRSYFRIEFRK